VQIDDHALVVGVLELHSGRLEVVLQLSTCWPRSQAVSRRCCEQRCKISSGTKFAILKAQDRALRALFCAPSAGLQALQTLTNLERLHLGAGMPVTDDGIVKTLRGMQRLVRCWLLTHPPIASYSAAQVEYPNTSSPDPQHSLP